MAQADIGIFSLIDSGHILLLVVILFLLVKGIFSEKINSTERQDMVNRVMAGSLTEYANAKVAIEKARNNIPTEEEEIAALDEKMRKDRVSV